MADVRILYKDINERLGTTLLIRDNPEYPESIEIIKLSQSNHEQYLLPKHAMIEAVKAMTKAGGINRKAQL